MYIKLDREYEIKCSLGTIKDIESRFGKPFFTLISAFDKLTTTEQIQLLYVGARRADPSLSEKEFVSACEDNLGLGELTDYLEQYVYQLQYPGLSKEEVQQRIEKKLRDNRALREAQGSIGARLYAAAQSAD